MDYQIANPDPGGTITSLSSLGYSIEAAVADLVDNSIAAHARTIHVIFTWAAADSWVAVVDDGTGMDENGLVTAMTVAGRGPAADRAAGDLGRFGMGLKTASFSQAQQVTVHTAPHPGAMHTRTWDLDEVLRTHQWRLLIGADTTTADILASLLPGGQPGTVVIWRRLHRYADATDTRAQKQFYADAEHVTAHLAMVFGRFLTGRGQVKITVSGETVEPWDPFLSAHPSTLRLAAEEVPEHGHVVNIEAFVLPSLRRLSDAERKAAEGPTGWLGQQGFYVYRRRRLILAGSWLGIRHFRRDERFNLARIAVDIPAEADAHWRLDVRKASAVPPVGIRRHLERIGHDARTRAAAVHTHRGGAAARAHSAEHVYTWRVNRSDGRVRCTINRDHPLVHRVLTADRPRGDDLRALLRLVEETVPVAALRILHEVDTEDDHEPFAHAATAEVTEVARRVLDALVVDGCTPGEARAHIAKMPPFADLSGFWSTGT